MMGIHIIKYLSHIFQTFSLILWSGSLLMIVFIIAPQIKRKYYPPEVLIDSIEKLGHVFEIAIIFAWSGILSHLIISPVNPLKSRLYILYIILTGLLTLLTIIQIYVNQYLLIKSYKSSKLYQDENLKPIIEEKIQKYRSSYFYFSLFNLIIVTIIILLNQY